MRKYEATQTPDAIPLGGLSVPLGLSSLLRYMPRCHAARDTRNGYTLTIVILTPRMARAA